MNYMNKRVLPKKKNIFTNLKQDLSILVLIHRDDYRIKIVGTIPIKRLAIAAWNHKQIRTRSKQILNSWIPPNGLSMNPWIPSDHGFFS